MADEEQQQPVSADDVLRQVQVSDLLLGTVASLAQLASARLAEGESGEARLAIESLRALAPVLREALPDDAARELEQALANLQLAYASAVAKRAKAEQPEQEPEAGEPPSATD